MSTTLRIRHQYRIAGEPSLADAAWYIIVRLLTSPPAGVRWVVVADRGADDIAYLDTCHSLGFDFCIRMAYERRLMNEDQPATYLLTRARSWPVQATRTITIRGRGGRPGRQAELAISYGAVKLRVQRKRVEWLEVWIVRAWEPEPPEGVEALEWILATAVPVLTEQDAFERLDWYTARWLVEAGNRDNKTGVILREGGDDHQLTSLLHLHRLLLANLCLHWLVALTGLQAFHDLPDPAAVERHSTRPPPTPTISPCWTTAPRDRLYRIAAPAPSCPAGCAASLPAAPSVASASAWKSCAPARSPISPAA